jgi:hypothetical protein
LGTGAQFHFILFRATQMHSKFHHSFNISAVRSQAGRRICFGDVSTVVCIRIGPSLMDRVAAKSPESFAPGFEVAGYGVG